MADPVLYRHFTHPEREEWLRDHLTDAEIVHIRPAATYAGSAGSRTGLAYAGDGEPYAASAGRLRVRGLVIRWEETTRGAINGVPDHIRHESFERGAVDPASRPHLRAGHRGGTVAHYRHSYSDISGWWVVWEAAPELTQAAELTLRSMASQGWPLSPAFHHRGRIRDHLGHRRILGALVDHVALVETEPAYPSSRLAVA